MLPDILKPELDATIKIISPCTSCRLGQLKCILQQSLCMHYYADIGATLGDPLQEAVSNEANPVFEKIEDALSREL